MYRVKAEENNIKDIENIMIPYPSNKEKYTNEANRQGKEKNCAEKWSKVGNHGIQG